MGRERRVRLLELARAWVAVGTQSIGGGTSTLLLIRRILVERRGWISRREYAELIAFSQLSLGIHLVALAALIGNHLAGLRGVAVSVAGMMLPAAAITVALTMAFASVADHAVVRAALAGVTPVTAGMTAGLGLVSARGAMRRGGRGIVDLGVTAVALALLLAAPVSPVAVIVGAGAIGAAALGREKRPPDPEGG
ncbi:MAG TPA: chromate transporter [Candidatus Limnocylindria bacterium]|nr:chromate transporter [Candidatus Limnocylindria bacterium]